MRCAQGPAEKMLKPPLHRGCIDAFLLRKSLLHAFFLENSRPLRLGFPWLRAGSGGQGGDPNVLYFTAGVNGEMDGLFGSLAAAAPVPEPRAAALLLLGVLGWGVFSYRRFRKT